MSEPHHRTEEEQAAEEKAAEQARVYALLYAKLHAPPDPPLEATRNFVHHFFSDDSWEEAREDIARRSVEYPRTVLAGLAGIEGLLANPPAEQAVLYNLVMWDANKGLDDDPTDEGAAAWLREVAEMVREVLGDKQPPR